VLFDLTKTSVEFHTESVEGLGCQKKKTVGGRGIKKWPDFGTWKETQVLEQAVARSSSAA